jgi:hypothetical protein
MVKTSIRGIVHTSIVTAFTITAAFIWKDVITEFIEVFIPAESKLFYKFVAAIIATFLVVIAIYTILRTEEEAAHLFNRINHKKK